MWEDKRQVIVEWMDACCDSSWQTADSIVTPSPCVTMGWLWHEDDAFIMVAATATSSGDFNQTMCIPRGMITKIVDLITTKEVA
jgi:hypothetical protein